MFFPNVNPAPRGLRPQPVISSGSLHNRSHIGPSWGTSWYLSSCFIESNVVRVGLSPPCRQKIYFPVNSKKNIIKSHLAFDQCSEWQIIKQVRQIFPYIGISVFPEALVIKPVDLRDCPAFMVSAQNTNSVFISDFEGYLQTDCFYREVPSVNVIAKE